MPRGASVRWPRSVMPGAMKRHLTRVLTVLLSCASLGAAAQNASSSVPPQVAGSAKTQLTWFGHAAFRLVTPSGKVILIDPWITNPLKPNGKKDLEDLKKGDLMLVSHGHADHVVTRWRSRSAPRRGS